MGGDRQGPGGKLLISVTLFEALGSEAQMTA